MPKIVRTQSAHNAELERERLTSLINSMADGVIAVDEHAKVVVTNGAAMNILDSNSTLTGKSLSRALELVDKNGQPIDVKKLVLTAETPTSSREYQIVYTDGSKANLYTSIAPVRLGYGQDGMKGYVLLLRDITREKSLEEERDEFISVVSHELRTPITIAEGNVGNASFILKRAGIDNKEVLEALETAHEQINFLAGLINDLATLSRAERGKLVVEPESINVAELLDELGRTYEPDAKAKGLEFIIEKDPKLALLTSGKLYTREVLQNFITNSIKYTEKGHVVLGAHQKTDGVEFYVSDTGIGISKPDQEKVFDKFFRSDDYRTGKTNGTGLGLYVTMKLARLLHADINMESKLNHGSTFTILIPNLNIPKGKSATV